MHSSSKSYSSVTDSPNDVPEKMPWYWRLVALAASWMILGGYLLLPGLYAKDPQLKIGQAVLTVFVVALLTAGYSFTALLCFACRDSVFQAEGVFLPALTSSTIGVLTIAYNFLLSRANVWGTAAVTGTVISVSSTVTYTGLYLLARRRTSKRTTTSAKQANLWSEQPYYSNYVQNMYPTASHTSAPAPEPPMTEEDRVNAQMALLLVKSNAAPPSDPRSATYRIDLPEDRDLLERQAHSQELVGTPGTRSNADWNRARAESMPESLSEEQAWQQWQDRGRSPGRPVQASVSGRSGHSRNLSREERRREIELGHP